MSALAGKQIVLGVGGGIAAYKAAELASQLTQAGARVSVILTANARQFVQPLTFAALTGTPVATDLFDPARDPMEHIALAARAELVVVAPATANLIARLAAGLADDLLTTVVLATRAPVLIVPAMNTHMLEHPATRANLERLRAWGYQTVEPDSGRMACGTVGAGRLPEPDQILEQITRVLAGGGDLNGLRLLITAGPTQEAIDPVRYLSNHSSGKMGYALAARALARGAQVTLISGPTGLPPPSRARVIPVVTAEEMVAAAVAEFEACAAVISAAAIADFRPAQIAARKLKRRGRASISLELEATPDLLATLAERRQQQLLVGFAAETNDLETEARAKLERKGLDLIVANDVTQPGAGFASDSNAVILITRDRCEPVPLMDKHAIADRVLDVIVRLRNGASGAGAAESGRR